MIRTLDDIIKKSGEVRESIALMENAKFEIASRDVKHMYGTDERREHFKELNSIQNRLTMLYGMGSTLDYLLNYDVTIDTSPTYFNNYERINIKK